MASKASVFLQKEINHARSQKQAHLQSAAEHDKKAADQRIQADIWTASEEEMMVDLRKLDPEAYALLSEAP